MAIFLVKTRPDKTIFSALTSLLLSLGRANLEATHEVEGNNAVLLHVTTGVGDTASSDDIGII